MESAVMKWLLDNSPWFAFTFIAIIVAIIVTWRLSKYHSSLEEVRTAVNKLPCNSHKSEIENLKVIEATVHSMNNILLEISKWIMKFDNDTIDVLAKKCSPLKMTSVGSILFNESNAKEVVDDNIEYLIQRLEAIKPKTPYDVEDGALKVLLSNMANPMFDKVKQYIYYSREKIPIHDPDTNKDVTVTLSLMSLIKLMGIYLRDCYMKRHPEISRH